MNENDYVWLLTQPVTGEVDDAGSHIWNSNRPPTKIAVLKNTDEGLLFDGQYVDVGDSLMAYLVVMDDIAEHGHSEPFGEEWHE